MNEKGKVKPRYSDNSIMPLSKMISVILKVLSNSTVWGTCIVVVLFMNFASYVQHYHKKPPPVRKAVKKQVAENTAAAEGADAAKKEGGGESKPEAKNAEKK